MRSRRSLRLGLPALLASALSLAGCAAEPPPNIILIVIDTARADHFSCYGYGLETTPRLDELAEDAVLFRNALSPAPWTLPSHASMFTGLPPAMHGLRWLDRPLEEGGRTPLVGQMTARARERLLAARLGRMGYATLGISNNVWVTDATGLDQGFDHFYDMKEEIPGLVAEYRSWPEEIRVPQPLFRGRSGKTLARLKRSFQQGEVQAPFFVFLNLIEPHFPYLAPAFRDRFGGDDSRLLELDPKGLEISLLAGALELDTSLLSPLYDAELYFVDTALGRLFDWLKEGGLYDDSWIVVTSDHGEHLGEDGRYSHQLSMERELLWVPLIIKLPGNRQGGLVDDRSLVSTADLYRTILAGAGDEPVGGSADRWSIDLFGDDDGRTWSLSEYYFSYRYLSQLTRRRPEFDVEPHQAVRRLVRTAGGEFLFREQVLESSRRMAEGAGDEAELAAKVVAALASHVQEAAQSSESDSLEDSETLESLRALGYVD